MQITHNSTFFLVQNASAAGDQRSFEQPSSAASASAFCVRDLHQADFRDSRVSQSMMVDSDRSAVLSGGSKASVSSLSLEQTGLPVPSSSTSFSASSSLNLSSAPAHTSMLLDEDDDVTSPAAAAVAPTARTNEQKRAALRLGDQPDASLYSGLHQSGAWSSITMKKSGALCKSAKICHDAGVVISNWQECRQRCVFMQ